MCDWIHHFGYLKRCAFFCCRSDSTSLRNAEVRRHSFCMRRGRPRCLELHERDGRTAGGAPWIVAIDLGRDGTLHVTQLCVEDDGKLRRGIDRRLSPSSSAQRLELVPIVRVSLGIWIFTGFCILHHFTMT